MINNIFDKEIAKILTIFSISQGSILNSKIIKKERRLLSLNLENEKARAIVNIIAREYKELKELPLQVYFSLIDVVHFLSRFKELDVYLFGSYAKLIFNEKSDIDLAVISDKLAEEDKKEFSRFVGKIERRHKKILKSIISVLIFIKTGRTL
jgi:DNA polymerase sigma